MRNRNQEITRRKLLGLFGAIASVACTCARADFPKGTHKQQRGESPDTGTESSRGRRLGCSLSAEDDGALESGKLSIVYSCGIPQMDVLMRQEANLVQQVMRVRPGFYFLDDRDSANAYATPTSVTSDTDGSVLFGVQLFHQEAMKHPLSGNALIGILAHEHGHIMEFQHGANGSSQQMELLADYMAGWYLGLKAINGVPGLDIRVLASSLFEKGNYDFNSPTFHGTPEQRVNAMLTGFQVAVNGGTDSSRAFDYGRRQLGF